MGDFHCPMGAACITRVMAIPNKLTPAMALGRIREELRKRNVEVAGAVYFDTALSEASLVGTVPADCQAMRDIQAIAAGLLDEVSSDVQRASV